jgi:predicted RNA polymerase sigma factor
MEIQASRLRARVASTGEPLLLDEQDRGRWDQLLIRRGDAALDRAVSLGRGLGPYGLQAAIAACHARAANLAQTDWGRVSALYDALAEIAPSPVVDLNRAVAVSMAYGPQAGLEALGSLATAGPLRDHYLLAAVQGDLFSRLGRTDEARREFERAASLTLNEAERELLLRRAGGLREGGLPLC